MGIYSAAKKKIDDMVQSEMQLKINIKNQEENSGTAMEKDTKEALAVDSARMRQKIEDAETEFVNLEDEMRDGQKRYWRKRDNLLASVKRKAAFFKEGITRNKQIARGVKDEVKAVKGKFDAAEKLIMQQLRATKDHIGAIVHNARNTVLPPLERDANLLSAKLRAGMGKLLEKSTELSFF